MGGGGWEREGELAFPPLGQTKGNIWILFVWKKIENKAVFSLVLVEVKGNLLQKGIFFFISHFFSSL